MKNPCSQCSHPTNRPDLLCKNCFAKNQKGLHASTVEPIVLHDHRLYCVCGENNAHALILLEKNDGDGILPKNNSPRYRDDRALLAFSQPDKFFGRCYNCQQDKYNRSPGRPRKYKDPEEREFIAKNRQKIYLANLNRRVIQSYGINGEWPGCVICKVPATRVLFVGEFGKAPVGNQYWYCRKLALTDQFWRNQFLPYCDHHEVTNIGQRGKEYRRRRNETYAEALAKGAQTMYELSL